ncbi:MAG: two component transcriptional regulator, winged helix family [Planctomycetaceae bacterium]|nr:two component transcriptional regulator, winged helix family [Planctomycetaceae bacterium]
MPSPRTLVVEDDAAIRRGIMDALRSAGHQPTEAARGDDGLQKALTGEFDLMLLDMVLPGNSGWEILRVLRAARPELPIIVLTACGAENQRVEGLQLGADDYVVKPFSLRELLARVGAVLRRVPVRPTLPVQVPFDGGIVDVQSRKLTMTDGRQVDLSEKEAEVLAFLAERSGQVVSRAQLLAGVWGLNPKGLNTRTVDMHITRLREKLSDDSANPRVLKTIWGRGYQFIPDHQGERPV